MALGIGAGMVPALLPDPARTFLLWILFGTLGGFAIPSMSVLILIVIAKKNTRVWWWMSGIGAVVGVLVGIVAAARGEPLPEAALVFAASAGGLAGFGVAEFCLRRIDERNRQRGRLAEPSAAPDRRDK